ncbi:PREDICTED: uncharacterized protein LOC108545990, partial [Eufriesea mexicana]|uniref:uncharacterized protein LOC108545990 n=1 Tax=Eufriesea mexicana TaxID=516756 RepID=UPI00083BC228
DQKGAQLYLGINHCGILTFQGSRKTHHFRWPEVQKINYEGKMFIVHLTISEDVRTKKKHTVGFKCPTGSNCRHVWRCAIEQMLFFTLSRASDAPVVSGGSIFSWGTKFKYTGRTEKEVLEETGPLRKEEPPIQRCQTTCLRRKASSVPATPSTPSQDLVEIRYSSLPRSCLSAGLDGAGMSEGSTGVSFSSPYCPDNTLPLLEPVSEDQEIHGRRNNAVDEKDTHVRATHNTTTTTTTTTTITFNTTTNRAKVRMKYPKSTLNRPQPLYSQKIVIGSEELVGRDIDNVVRQRINALEKSPKVVRSTALIIKSSKVPAESLKAGKEIANETYIFPTADSGTIITTVIDGPFESNTGKPILRRSNEQVSMLARQENEVTCRGIGTTTKTANGYITSATTDVADVRNGVEATKRRERTVGQHECVINDYYFRDSFDHSSSDSQLLDASGKPHSPSMTPVPKMQKLQNSKVCLQQQQQQQFQHQRQPSRRLNTKLRHKSLRITRLFIPAFMLTMTVLFIVIVLVFETDTTLFNNLRKTPEMVALQNQYYVPIKEFLRTKLGLF